MQFADPKMISGLLLGWAICAIGLPILIILFSEFWFSESMDGPTDTIGSADSITRNSPQEKDSLTWDQ